MVSSTCSQRGAAAPTGGACSCSPARGARARPACSSNGAAGSAARAGTRALFRPIAAQSLPLPDLEAAKGLDRALYLHMAAMAALRGEAIKTGNEALRQTLRHERLFWRGQVKALGLDGALTDAMLDALETAVAITVLAGGAGDRARARSLIEALLPPGRLRPDLLDAMVGLLRQLYGGAVEKGGRGLQALPPEVLGEGLVAACLSRDESLLTRLLAGAEGRGAAM